MIYTSPKGEKFVMFQLGETIDDICEQVFILTLAHNHWNKTKTGKALGISLRTVRLWTKRFDLIEKEEIELAKQA